MDALAFDQVFEMAQRVARPLAWKTRLVQLKDHTRQGKPWTTYCRVCAERESQQDLYEYVAQYGVCLELILDSDAVLMQKVEVEGKLIWRGPCKHCGTTHWAWAI